VPLLASQFAVSDADDRHAKAGREYLHLADQTAERRAAHPGSWRPRRAAMPDEIRDKEYCKRKAAEYAAKAKAAINPQSDAAYDGAAREYLYRLSKLKEFL
jgi:hypothetical protein